MSMPPSHPRPALRSFRFSLARSLSLLALVTLGGNGAAVAQSPSFSGGDPSAIVPAGPVKLFNGKNLEGLSPWLRQTQAVDSAGVFSVTPEGYLRISGADIGNLHTSHSYQDFIAVLEFKWGEATWKYRKLKAKDAGFLIHCQGPAGEWDHAFMPGLEIQIMEGGMGDFITLDESPPIPSFTARVEQRACDADNWNCRGGYLWSPDGTPRQFAQNLSHIHAKTWDADWRDQLGYRSAFDLESTDGDWNQLVVIADGSSCRVFFNGTQVNELTDFSQPGGKLQLQTELAEWFIRRWELLPLGSHVGPLIACTALPPIRSDADYDAEVSVVGLNPPFRWTVAAGELPPGFVLDPTNGRISGTTKSSENWEFTIEVRDRNGLSAQSRLTIAFEDGPTTQTTGR